MPLTSQPCDHTGKRIGFKLGNYVTACGHGGSGPNNARAWSKAMNIQWMTKQELSQAIPPAYTQYIGNQLTNKLRHEHASISRHLTP